MYTTISHSEESKKTFSLGFIKAVNHWISKEESNYFGICGMLLIVGTGLASIPVAIATGLQLFIIAGISVILAMAGNVMVISQQPLKTVVWTFLIGMTVNALLMVYLIWMSFV